MKAKKSLGQNFLKSVPALKKIISTGEVKEGDLVLEIGPGKGALTEKLLEAGARVLAVEKDKELVEYLQQKFYREIKERKLKLIEGDILNIGTSFMKHQFLSGPRFSSPSARPDHAKNYVSLHNEPQTTNYELSTINYKLIANIPYNITGAILKKFLTEDPQPEKMVLLVQNEVAKRVTSKEGSILSISVKAYGKPKLIMKVPKRYFSPSPKVDSAIISIENISREFFEGDDVDEKKFWGVVHSGFAHKRKVLLGNLKKTYPALDWEHIFQEAGIKTNVRAEELSIFDWQKIARWI